MATVDLVLVRARLVEAEAAYHSVLMGGAVKVVVDQNGERIEFTAVNTSKLAAYILYLKSLLGEGDSTPLQVWM